MTRRRLAPVPRPAGTTRPTANLALNELQQQGIVTLSRGRIQINDLRRLAAQGDKLTVAVICNNPAPEKKKCSPAVLFSGRTTA